jgi:hypothetical protein
MRAVVVLGALAMSATLALTGCGYGHGRPPATEATRGIAGVTAGSLSGPASSMATSFARGSLTVPAPLGPGGAVRFRMTQYYPVITNAGTPDGYAVFIRVFRDVRVQPSSAAKLLVTGDGPATLTPPAERARWLAAGAPPLPHFPAKPLPVQMPAGTFSFIPQGTVLTYHAAASLPASAAAVSRQIRAMLAPYAGARPLPTQMLTQFGYLLASAPLTAAGRSAVWMSVATLPGLRLCPPATDLAGRTGSTLCVSAAGHQTELVVDPASGTVLAVEDRLLQASADYPAITPGTLVQSATFTLNS